MDAEDSIPLIYLLELLARPMWQQECLQVWILLLIGRSRRWTCRPEVSKKGGGEGYLHFLCEQVVRHPASSVTTDHCHADTQGSEKNCPHTAREEERINTVLQISSLCVQRQRLLDQLFTVVMIAYSL